MEKLFIVRQSTEWIVLKVLSYKTVALKLVHSEGKCMWKVHKTHCF